MSVESGVSPGNWLNINVENFRAQFERKPFAISHTLVNHPLLQLPRVVELAMSMPEQNVEFSSAVVPLHQDYLKTPKNGLSLAETLHQIEKCNSWMVLKKVESDPEYMQLLLECLEQLRPYAEEIAPGMCKPEAFIFVSSPHAVTPYHCDPEHNFLLQVRGEKQMAVFDRDDAEVVSQQSLEGKVTGAHRNLPFNEQMHDHETLFEMRPGVGIHVPMYCPHWVRVGPEVSVSFSITFRSRNSARREAVLRMNSRLRSRGLTPTPPGKQLLNDELKYFTDRVVTRLSSALGPFVSSKGDRPQ
jgi:hypothetical protein